MCLIYTTKYNYTVLVKTLFFLYESDYLVQGREDLTRQYGYYFEYREEYVREKPHYIRTHYSGLLHDDLATSSAFRYDTPILLTPAQIRSTVTELYLPLSSSKPIIGYDN